MSCEMTASLRRLVCSPATPLLEDDDLLAEILLRLPPLPSSPRRASAVCSRWRRLASDPRFSRRFCICHRRNPPLLGCFVRAFNHTRFQPTLEAPNRVSEDRFTIPITAGDGFITLGCRHGLVLIFHTTRSQLLVWDPVTGDQHRLDIPPGFDTVIYPIAGAVLRAAGDVHHFQVVLVGSSDVQRTQPVAYLYSSKTGLWGDLTTATLPPGDSSIWVYPGMPAVMVGDSLYLFVAGNSLGILEFDLNRQNLALIPVPVEETLTGSRVIGNILVILTEGGGLGFLFVSKFSAQLWKRKTNFDGVTSWVLERTVALDKLLSINSEKEAKSPSIIGFAEENNVVLLWTSIGVFTVQFESLRFKKLFKSDDAHYFYHPYEVVYTADKGIDGAELLQNV